jgi:hypothetical protein
MKNKVYIYGLSGDNGLIRYVGKSYRPNVRINEHICEAKKQNKKYHKINWINKLLENGEDLHITILEECDDEIWRDREVFWISQFSGLTNTANGGFGGCESLFNMSYNEVKLWVNENLPQIKTSSMWREYVKNNDLPYFIPKRPDSVYKNKGWVSEPHFFNNELAFISYEELKELVQKNSIKNIPEYKSFRTKNMPSNPNVWYKDKWVSWFDFLNTTRKKTFLSFTEAKKIIYNLKFVKRIEYINWYKINKHLKLPNNPPMFYDEWNGWADFLGNHKIIKKSNKFLTYYDAKKWVNENTKIKTYYDWRNNTDKLPKFIPKRPDYLYKNSGWSNWKNFLN